MPIQHAVLALLAEKESYGYELKSSFERAIGPQWGELNIGHLYQVLDRLVRDGLATYRVVRQVDRPDKHLYKLTKVGHRELDRWLATPSVRSSGHRDELFIKLFASARLGTETLREAARSQRGAYLSELRALTELRHRAADDPLVELLIKAATLHTQANLDVVETADRDAVRISEATKAQEDAAPPVAEPGHAGTRSTRRRPGAARGQAG
jgi:DNA-binding PadR family transcriptional regulator